MTGYEVPDARDVRALQGAEHGSRRGGFWGAAPVPDSLIGAGRARHTPLI